MKPIFGNKKYIVSIFLTILIVSCTHIASYADITPVSERTPQVRDAIVAEVPGVNSAADVTAAHLAAITYLDIGLYTNPNQTLTSLKDGDFDGLTSLTGLSLLLYNLDTLPSDISDIFDGLTSLTTLFLVLYNLDTLPSDIFDELTALTDLRLVTNFFPSGIFDNLTNLTDLNLYYHADSPSLPAGIFDNLTNLKTLELAHISPHLIPTPGVPASALRIRWGNGLTSLPAGIFDNLTNLKTLNLPSNALTSLPSDIFDNLTTLTDLNLDFNLISDVSELEDLTSLTSLSVGWNPIWDYGPLRRLKAANPGVFIDIDLNNNPPVFSEGDSTTRSVPENTPSDVNIGAAISATDADGFRGRDLSYLLGGTDAESFRIDFRTGQLKTRAPLDYETKASYTVTVFVTNGNGGDRIDVTINVTYVSELLTNRTPQVRDAIVAAVPGVNSANDVIEAHLAAITALDLSSQNIPALKSGDFDGLTALTNLNLSDNDLTSLPEDVFNGLASLTTLTLETNKLTALRPDIFDGLTALTNLDLSNLNNLVFGEFTTLPVDVFDGLTALTTLNLQGNDFRTLPAGIFDGLTALADLWLNTNKLATLPAGVFDGLTKLEKLRLSGNDLTTLPGKIFDDLTSAETIWLDNNELSSLPVDTFDGLTSIKTLFLSDNELTSLPDGIFDDLTALGALFLSYNELTSLPDGIFDDLTALSQLRLDNNGLTSVPSGIFENLTELSELWLADNKLRSLPDGIFEGLHRLRSLSLGGNVVDPMPISVSLEKVGDGQFKAVAPTGAPFAIVLPLTVTNGSISGGATTVRIPTGSVESKILILTRPLGTILAATVNIGTLPGIPTYYNSGYTLVKSTTDLPLTVIPAGSNNAPVFTDGTSTTRSIAENTASGQNIGTAIAATDADSGDTLTYTLSGTDAASFSIVSTTGQLQTKAALDYETKTSYSVTVSVSDGNGGTDSITVTINVTDVNETPITPVSERTPQVRDAIVTAVPGVNSAADVTAAHLAAITSLSVSRKGITSLKIGDFDGLTALTWLSLEYNNLSSLPTGIFDDNTALTFLSFSDNNINALPARIFDNNTALTQIEFGHNDLSSLPAGIFDNNTALGWIKLNDNDLSSLPAGIFDNNTALYNLWLYNNDLSSLPAGIFDNNAALKTLNLSSNKISDVSELERVTSLNRLLLKGNPISDYGPLRRLIAAIDAMAGHPGLTLDITIPPETTNTAPVFTDGTSTTRAIAENTAPGKHIGTAIAATDADNDTLTYTLGGTDAAAFEIDATTGQLKTNAALDYETKSTYTVTVTVSDSSSTTTITVTINITDINELPTSTAICKVGDVLKPGESCTYPGTNDVFSINANGTGQFLFFTAGNNLNIKNTQLNGVSYTLVAKKLANGSWEIEEIADSAAPGTTNNAPVFTDGTSTTRSIAENTTSGQHIGTAITATDADNDTLTYTLSGTDAAAFEIDATTGQLKTNAALDYETKNTYTVTVTVSDGSSTTTITVTINITDINELPTSTAICKVGDVLAPGQSCTYPGTDAVFSVLGDGTAQWHIPNLPTWLEWINQTAVSGSLRVSTTVNGQAYHFVAEQVGTSWEIKEIGDDRSDPQPETPEQPEETPPGGGTPTLAVSTAAPLNEATLHEGIVTLTLTGGTYEGSTWKLRDAVSVAGITGIALDRFDTERIGDTKMTVKLEFDGNINTDSTLTLTLGAAAIADYNGAALTAQIPVTAVSESITASTAAPLTEATLDESVVTLTLSGRKFERWNSAIRPAVSVSGIVGVTVGNFDIDRESDTEVTVELTYDGNMTADGTLTFTVGADAIAGYNGPALMAQVPVAAGTETPVEPETPEVPEPPIATNKPIESDYDHIEGPWLWMIAPGGDIDTDNLSEASEGVITEPQIAQNGVNEGDHFDALQWTSGRLRPTTVCGIFLCSSNNVINVVRQIGLTDSHQLSQYSAYALINIHSPRDQNDVLMGVGSDDSIKVWLNGSVVYENDVTRRTTGIQNRFPVNLNAGDNLLLIKVCNHGTLITNNDWGMFFKIYLDTQDYTVSLPMGEGNSWQPVTVVDDPTNTAPVFTDGTSTTRTIAENTASGQHIGTAIAATDADNDTLTYTLSGTDASAFSIDGTTGQLKTRAALDYETKNSYTVTITVSDGSLTDTITVTINVTDINEKGGDDTNPQPDPPEQPGNTGETPTLAVSTAAPLTEATLHGGIITLTLSGGTYESSSWRIREAVTVSGILGITVETFDVDRVNDTEITVELTYDGNMSTNGTLTFTVGAGAIKDYNGAALTRQISVPAVTESVTASTAAPLTEATLDESIITLTLSGRKFERWNSAIRPAVSVSGISGVTVGSFDIDRESDTEVSVELTYDGNMTTDSTLTITVGADAIAGYNGPAFTVQVAVSVSEAPADTGGQNPDPPEQPQNRDTPEPPINTAGTPTLTVSTSPSPLTEATLHGSVVTLTLSGGTYEHSRWDIEDAVSVSGISGVTFDGFFDLERVSDTKVTIELEFSGNITTNGTLTFTVGSDGIQGYNGAALTVQIQVTANTESVAASTTSLLKEATLDGSVVTLTLSGAKYSSSIWDIRDGVSVSGIKGVTKPWNQPERKSDTELTIELEFDGTDFDSTATLTFTVEADAIAGYNGSALTTQITVTAMTESVVASSASPLREATLDGSVVTLTISGAEYTGFIWDIRDAVSVSGISGVTMPWNQPERKSDTQITIELEFDGNMTTDGTLTFTVGADAIAGYNGTALTAQITVTADRENVLLANFPNPFNPETWIPYQLAKPAEVTITIYASNGQLVRTLALGHQPDGFYYSRSRAAYWDGRNAFGEPVASGVYFYTITAGDFTATRKMLIRK